MDLTRLLPLALVSCAFAPAPVILPPDLPPEQWRAVERVELPAVPASGPERGGIVVEIVDAFPPHLDPVPRRVIARSSDQGRPCYQHVWLLRGKYERQPETLAHEIGHALGLAHVSDPANVMFDVPPVGGGGVLDRDQLERTRLGASFLRWCRRGPR